MIHWLAIGLLLINMGLVAFNLCIGVKTMTTADDIKAQQDRQAKALKNIAADVRELIGKVTAPGGISEADAQAIADKGEEIAAGLEAVAAEYVSADEGTDA